MCTAATYKTKDFYFGRTLDYEFSYGDQIVITPRNYSFHFRHVGDMKNHYAIIGIYYYNTYENHQISAVDMHAEDLESNKLICYPVIQGERINYQNK